MIFFIIFQVDAAHLHWIFSVPVGITLCLIGLIGNFISIMVWLRIMKSKRSGSTATTIYLIVLGIVDSGLLFFFLITDTIPSNNPEVKKTFSYAAFYSYFGYPFFFFFIVASIWILVGVTATRFIMVLFPIKAKDWCSPKRAYIGIGSILACTFIINVPHFFSFRPLKVKDGYQLGLSEYGKSDSAQMYEFWVHCMFLVLVPWASIAIFNASIIHSMMKRTKYMQKLDKAGSSKPERSKQDRQMTRVLLTVTFTFLILLALQCITQCFFMLGDGKAKTSWNQNSVSLAYAFAKMAVVINSSINCFLYCFTGTVFRQEFFKMFDFKISARYDMYASTSGSTAKTSRADTTETFAESKA